MVRRYDLMVTVNTARHPILVIGGGPVGERKVRTLLDAGVAVILVSPDVTPPLEEMVRTGRISWKQRKAIPEDFERGMWALLAVSSSETRRMLQWARLSGTFCNCCSLPEEGDWALAAQFHREGFVFGVSSRGNRPSLAARWKRKLMEMFEEATQ